MQAIISSFGFHFLALYLAPCSFGSLGVAFSKYYKAKEELWELKYFTMQKYKLQKILYK
jgi:hypothetical protein